MTDESTRVALADAEQLLLRSLDCMINLLGNGHWSDHFQRCRSDLLSAKTWETKNAAASRIRSVYGGMGSFNDWYVDGTTENGDFDDLRTKLYDLSRTYENPKFAKLLLSDEGLA
jgi:hypothetical protein